MAPCLRILVALAKDQDSDPSTHVVLATISSSCARSLSPGTVAHPQWPAGTYATRLSEFCLPWIGLLGRESLSWWLSSDLKTWQHSLYVPTGLEQRIMELVAKSIAAVFPGNWLEMHVPRPRPWQTEAWGGAQWAVSMWPSLLSEIMLCLGWREPQWKRYPAPDPNSLTLH